MTTFQKGQTNYDLFAPEFLFNPYPLYKQIRCEDPVYFYEKGGLWLLTRYQDVEAAFQDQRLSSNRSPLFARQLHDLDFSIIQNFTFLMANMMLESDQPQHTALRKIALPGFAARALESWRSIIQETTDSLLDQVEAQHTMDIVADLSLQLPSLVITKIFGVPEEYRQDFIQWGKDIANFWGVSGSDNIEAIARNADTAAASFTTAIKNLIAERQQQPGTDMISLLIAAYSDNEMSLDVLPSLCIDILVGGYVGITDLIPNGVNALLNHPQELQRLKENPELINSAVEEIIRFDTPGTQSLRIAKENLTIGGKEIPAGSVVALVIAAANYDPEKFDNPEVFNITRSPNEHLGFGKGAHFCIGAVLARMELTICFSTLLRRMPNLTFDPNSAPIPRRSTLAFKGFESLRVTF
ncbi:cytochrome P450 [Cylindrospermum sp. FACHB-282]|uniref:cytochrome P450 n=1 Tax=Cylindrospermum sp. FACHB-282 TaxID=2692794 RepID=UPI0016831782|nr:cytochrome P450 [Cylindrospermum sp. FACHB-282]MBD2384726.1 cytochrome P450 [Cylindrospermum sp. FACHB-282]